MSPLCQTLSNAFDVSSKTPLTSYPSPKDFQISWVMERGWFIQESPGLKSDWLEKINSCAMKNWNWKLQQFVN